MSASLRLYESSTRWPYCSNGMQHVLINVFMYLFINIVPAIITADEYLHMGISDISTI